MRKLFLTLFMLQIASIAAQDCVCNAPNYWLEAEYLGWVIKDNPVPVPLVTTASLDDPIPGALGQPGTHVVLGDSDISMGWMNGFEISSGAWLEDNRRLGFEASYFLLPSVSRDKSLATSGLPGSANFAVPIFDVTGVFGLEGIPGESIFILPGPLFGSPGFQGVFDLSVSSKLQGVESNALLNLADGCPFDFYGILGFRWVQLEESLSFSGSTQSAPGSAFSDFFNFEDRFRTTNNFYGGQLGLAATCAWNCFLFDAHAKVGVGTMNEKIAISGISQTSHGNLFFLTEGTADELLSGGIFGQLTNIGVRHYQNAAVLIDTGFKASYELTDQIAVSIGYNFLWLNRVTRPGNQIDRRINPTLTALASASRETVGVGPGPIPFGSPGPAPAPSGPEVPKPLFNTSDFWAQGLTVGVIINF